MIHAIDIFFRLLNFGVVVAGLVYVVKKYAIPMINNFMRKEQQAFDDLQHQNSEIQKCCNRISEEYDSQEKWFNDIEQKFVKWQDVVAQKDEQRKHDEHATTVIMQERYNARASAVAQKRFVQKEVLPMLDSVHNQLKTKYKHHADQKSYVQHLVASVKDKS